jgi:hypothetical protein
MHPAALAVGVAAIDVVFAGQAYVALRKESNRDRKKRKGS